MDCGFLAFGAGKRLQLYELAQALGAVALGQNGLGTQDIGGKRQFGISEGERNIATLFQQLTGCRRVAKLKLYRALFDERMPQHQTVAHSAGIFDGFAIVLHGAFEVALEIPVIA